MEDIKARIEYFLQELRGAANNDIANTQNERAEKFKTVKDNLQNLGNFLPRMFEPHLEAFYRDTAQTEFDIATRDQVVLGDIWKQIDQLLESSDLQREDGTHEFFNEMQKIIDATMRQKETLVRRGRPDRENGYLKEYKDMALDKVERLKSALNNLEGNISYDNFGIAMNLFNQIRDEADNLPHSEEQSINRNIDDLLSRVSIFEKALEREQENRKVPHIEAKETEPDFRKNTAEPFVVEPTAIEVPATEAPIVEPTAVAAPATENQKDNDLLLNEFKNRYSRLQSYLELLEQLPGELDEIVKIHEQLKEKGIKMKVSSKDLMVSFEKTIEEKVIKPIEKKIEIASALKNIEEMGDDLFSV